MQREVLGLVGDTVKFCGLGDISLYSLKMNEVREIVFTVSFSPSLLQEHKKGTSAPELDPTGRAGRFMLANPTTAL